MPSAPRIALEQWQALIAIVEAGSYAHAAELLHKSQSSVTYAVQKLESLLGVNAFEIQGRKAILTPTGQLLYRRARILLDEARGLEQAARRVSSGWEAEIHVAAEIIFPAWLLLQCLERFGAESPHTRVELIESVLAGTTEALVKRQVNLAISAQIPQGFEGDSLMRLRMIAVAHPDHALHKLGRPLTFRDLRAYRQLVVRESDTKRATPLAVEATQRWTVSHMATSIQAACMGYGYGWYSDERIRNELAAGVLKPLPLREGGERFGQLYLVFADRENAGPGTLRLAQIIRESAASECTRHADAADQPKSGVETNGRKTRAHGSPRHERPRVRNKT